jgi:pyruvate/2-oxoglutarate dehydrogenase complex dihydrolipoamide dehydrogenase (E3) component
MSEQFDLIVIGAGSAARDAANRAAREHGARVALVESTRWGGSCPNVACRPTKAYVVAADLAHMVNDLAEWMGIEAGPARVQLARTRAWKNSLLRPQESWVEVLSQAGYTLVKGIATFVDPRTVRVDERELTAPRILIATGSRTAVPPIPGLEDVEWIDHVTALDLEEVPEALLVVGGGPVGLEFAQIFRRFGSRVTIVNHDAQIASRADTESANELQAVLEDEGIEVILSSDVERLSRTGDSIEATVGGRTISVTQVLLASGRVPNVEALGLDRIGVELSQRGIVVDGHQRTTVEGIWAAGDVVAGPQLTPVAQYQARLAIGDMFGTSDRVADYSVLPSAIFTEPELGSVGLTEREAREAGHDVDVVKHPLPAVTRAQYTRTKHGHFKLVFDPTTRRVLGVHVVSRNASDIVGSLAPAMQLGLKVDDLAAMHHIYPSYSEGLKAAAEQAVAKR